MKTSNRVHHQSTINCPKHQPSQQAGRASAYGSAICKESCEAFAEFNDIARSAIALSLLNARHLSRLIAENHGREDFESADVVAGSRIIPRIVAGNYGKEFSIWNRSMLQMAKQIHSGEMADLIEPELDGEIEYSVRALEHLLLLQRSEFEAMDKKSCAYGCDTIVRQRLCSAFDRALNAYHTLASFMRANNGEVGAEAAQN